jgi:hypothetical protein
LPLGRGVFVPSSVPGAYRITVRRITAASGACLTTETLAMDAAALPLRVLRANSLHCWTLDVAAGEWLEIRNQQVFDGATGTISLRAPDGRVLASDPYGAAAGPIMYRCRYTTRGPAAAPYFTQCPTKQSVTVRRCLIGELCAT